MELVHRLVGAALPAGLAVLGVVEMALLRPAGWVAGAAVEVVACLLLLGRKSRPLLWATSAGAVLLVIPWVGPQLDEPAVPILVWAVAVYALGRWPDDLQGLVGVAVIGGATLFDYVFVDIRHHTVSDVVFVSALLLPPYVCGRVARRLADRQRLLEENQELVRREAARAERDRIARDMHDVIAHSISAMVVQSAAAEDLVATDPRRAAQAVRLVADTGRRALAETGRLLQVLRNDSEVDELGLVPSPGVADVPRLVQQFCDSGLRVELSIDEPLPALSAAVEVSAYRVVQEALTNALRYAADRTARLSIRGAGDEVRIETSNRVGGRPREGSGLGLLGLRERVELVGGTLRHQEGPDGWFVLDARLPATP